MTKSSQLSRCRTGAALAALLAVLLIGASPAAASGPPASRSESGGSQAAGKVGSGGGGGGVAVSGGEGLSAKPLGGLPFTWLDLIALLAVAVALTAMGLLLRRVGEAPDTGPTLDGVLGPDA